jgi:hypothetical protein
MSSATTRVEPSGRTSRYIIDIAIEMQRKGLVSF